MLKNINFKDTRDTCVDVYKDDKADKYWVSIDGGYAVSLSDMKEIVEQANKMINKPSSDFLTR